VESSREATTTSAATTAHATTEATAAHLSTKHLEEDFGVDLRAHATAHAAAKATTAKLFRGVDEIFTTVVTSALLRV
jgi:hypothetical protein